MRGRWVPAVLALTLGLGACGSETAADGPDGPSGGDQTQAPRPARDVELRVSARVATRPQPGSSDADELIPGPRDRGLLVSYALRNTGPDRAFVIDRIPVRDGSASGPSDQIDPLKAFLTVEDGTATIAKRTYPRTADAPDFTVRFQASALAPDATLTGRAFVPLPLATDDDGAAAGRWRLCLGVVSKVGPSALLPGGQRAMVPNDRLAGDFAQRLACSSPQQVPAS